MLAYICMSNNQDFKIIKYGNPLLSSISDNVVFGEHEYSFGTHDHINIAERLIKVLYFYQAVGVSAVQIGVPLKMFVMRTDKNISEKNTLLVINPKIITAYEENIRIMEGCLSFPEIFVPVSRPVKIIAEFYNLNGDLKTEEFNEMSARIFLHENDHLNGKTYLDRVSQLQKTISLDKIKKLKQKRKWDFDDKYLDFLSKKSVDELFKL